MSAPDTTADCRAGCRADLGEVCALCQPVAVPTATTLRPTPGSVAAELVLLRADHRRQILDIHTALDKCGAPLGGSPAERIEEWARLVIADRSRLVASVTQNATDMRAGELAAAERRADQAEASAEAAEAALDSIRDALEVSADMDAPDLVAVIEATMRQRKPSPMLPSILALLDMRAKGDEALGHLVALLKGAL